MYFLSLGVKGLILRIIQLLILLYDVRWRCSLIRLAWIIRYYLGFSQQSDTVHTKQGMVNVQKKGGGLKENQIQFETMRSMRWLSLRQLLSHRRNGKMDTELSYYFKYLENTMFTLNLSLPRVINFKFPLQLHQKYYITTVWRTWLFIAYWEESWLYYLPILTMSLIHFSSEGWGNVFLCLLRAAP